MSATLNTAGLDAILAGLDQALDDAAEETARVVEQVATQEVPVDTGALRTSIEVFGAIGSGARTVEAGQSLGYAPDVEYGTPTQRAQPFMTPAAAEGEAQMPDIYKKHLAALASRSAIK